MALHRRGFVPPRRWRREPETTVLYRVVQEQWETFVQRVAAGERVVPRFCVREVEGFMRCGILGYGFARVHCDACQKDDVVAFSCKGRGFCPSCGTRRMVDTAAWLVDRVLPEVPVRQWVLSMPYRVRVLCAYDPDACATDGALNAPRSEARGPKGHCLPFLFAGLMPTLGA